MAQPDGRAGRLGGGGLFALLVAYGLINGTGWVQFQRQTLAQAQQEEITRLDKLQSAIADIESGKVRFTGDAFADPRQPRTVGNNKGTRYATLPPGPLAPSPSARAISTPTISKSAPSTNKRSSRTTNWRTPPICWRAASILPL